MVLFNLPIGNKLFTCNSVGNVDLTIMTTSAAIDILLFITLNKKWGKKEKIISSVILCMIVTNRHGKTGQTHFDPFRLTHNPFDP